MNQGTHQIIEQLKETNRGESDPDVSWPLPKVKAEG